MAKNYRSLADIMKGQRLDAPAPEVRVREDIEYTDPIDVDADFVAREPVISKPVPVIEPQSAPDRLLRNAQEVIEQPIQQMPLSKQDIRDRDVAEARVNSAEMTNNISQLLAGSEKVPASEHTVDTPTIRPKSGMPDWAIIALAGLAGGVAGGGGKGLTQGAGAAAEGVDRYRKEKIAAEAAAARSAQEKAKLEQAKDFKKADLLSKLHIADLVHEAKLKGHDVKKDITQINIGDKQFRLGKQLESKEKIAGEKIGLGKSILEAKIQDRQDKNAIAKEQLDVKEALSEMVENGKMDRSKADIQWKTWNAKAKNDYLDRRFEHHKLTKATDQAFRLAKLDADSAFKSIDQDIKREGMKQKGDIAKARIESTEKIFGTKQAYTEKKGDREATRKEKKDEESARQFDTTTKQKDTQFDRTMGLKEKRFQFDESKFDKSHVEKVRQFNERHTLSKEKQAASESQFERTYGLKRDIFDENKTSKQRMYALNELNNRNKHFIAEQNLKLKEMVAKGKVAPKGLSDKEVTRIDGLQEKFHKRYAEEISAMHDSVGTLADLRSGKQNPVLNNLIIFKLAKAANGGGRLTDADVERFDGSKALNDRINRALETWKTGQMTDKDRTYLIDVLETVHRNTSATLMASAEHYADSKDKIRSFGEGYTKDDFLTGLVPMRGGDKTESIIKSIESKSDEEIAAEIKRLEGGE